MKPPLSLTPEEMRRAGYAVIDRIVDHLENLPGESPWGKGESPAPNPFKGPAPRAGRAAGFRPFCVIASSGTTNTGAVDPLHEIADLCTRETMWMHVDGAYGACAAFCDRGRAALSGIERAHSVSFDPHKWLFQPFEIGGVIVRDARWLHETFDVSASYMRDTKGVTRGVNFCEYGPQLTRSLRALKLWMTFHVFGADEIARAVANGFEMAEAVENEIAARPHWRLISRASMGIVSFRAAPEGWSDDAADGLNAEIAGRVRQEGRDMIATTVLEGRVALRMCPIHPHLTREAVAGSVERLDSHLKAVMAEAPRAQKDS